MDSLDGQVALVTGAGRGIGAGIALELATRGARVALMGRTESTLEESAELIRVSTATQVSVHPGDGTDEHSIEKVIDSVLRRHARIDVLVNNAGIAHQAQFLDIGLAGWNGVIANNPNGVVLVVP